MNGDDRPGADQAESESGTAQRPAEDGRDHVVTCAYTDVEGQSAFVIAAIDRDDAWIAVPRGTELDTNDLR